MNNQEDLIGKLLEASNQISKHSRRGPGNYMICGTAVGNHMKETFDEIEREEKKKMRNDKINDLLNGEE